MKQFPLLIGIVALSVSIASALPASSQSVNPKASTHRGQTQPGEMRRPNFLNLTAEQQAQMEQIRQSERSQIDAILTAEQKAQLQSDRANRRPPTGENRRTPPNLEKRGVPSTPFASLNLTAEQRSQIEAVMRTSRAQMDALLTPEQRQQIQQHQQRRSGKIPASNS